VNRILWSFCRKLIAIGRWKAVPPPDLYDIVHYAICDRCRNEIEAQGWDVELKHTREIVYEVTFKAVKAHIPSGECVGGEGEQEEDEEEDEDEELKVKRPKRLTVGEETPKRLEPDFYVI